MDTRVREPFLRWLWWALGIAATRFLPERIKTVALVVALFAFALWLGYDTWKTRRDLAAHHAMLAARKEARREGLEREADERGLSSRKGFGR